MTAEAGTAPRRIRGLRSRSGRSRTYTRAGTIGREGVARPARRVRQCRYTTGPGSMRACFTAFHQRWIGASVRCAEYGWAAARLLRPGRAVDPRADPGRADLAPVTREGEPSGTAPALAVATAPPRARVVRSTEIGVYARKADRVTVRHRHGQIVAVVEIVSPGNKGSNSELRGFVEKTCGLDPARGSRARDRPVPSHQARSSGHPQGDLGRSRDRVYNPAGGIAMTTLLERAFAEASKLSAANRICWRLDCSPNWPRTMISTARLPGRPISSPC